MEEQDIIKKFTFNRQTILDVGHQLEPDLLPHNRNPTSITPIVKLIVVLRFVVTGSFQYIVAVSGGTSQPTYQWCATRNSFVNDETSTVPSSFHDMRIL